MNFSLQGRTIVNKVTFHQKNEQIFLPVRLITLYFYFQILFIFIASLKEHLFLYSFVPYLILNNLFLYIDKVYAFFQ